jgi:hypothetical protein
MLRLRWGEELANDEKFVKYQNSSPLKATFYNGSVVYFIGLDDKKTGEKILGRTISTFLLDEASEIGYKTFSKLTTRLSEKSKVRKMGILTMNPTSVFGWTYKLFLQKKNPQDETDIKNPDGYKTIVMNPQDNLENLPEEYLENLENLSEHDKQRFLYGNFTSSVEGAVYESCLERCRQDQRICELGEPDKNYPVYIALDVGWDDFNSGWVYQILPNGIHFYYYIEENKIDIATFLDKINSKIWEMRRGKWGPTVCVLPHDASSKWVGTGMSVKQVLALYSTRHKDYTIEYKIMKIRGIYEGINAARIMFKRLWFDKVGCERGLARLGQYQEYINEGNDEFKQKTKHDAASHAADSFRYAISSFYFTNPYREEFERKEGEMYGADILSRQTRRKMGL